jgi:hypothetical protein
VLARFGAGRHASFVSAASDLGALAVYGIVLGVQMRNSFSRNNLATCLAHSLGSAARHLTGT